MSTKIYDSYRINKSQLSRFLTVVQEAKFPLYKKYKAKVIDKLNNFLKEAHQKGEHYTLDSYEEKIHKKEKMTILYDLCPETSISIFPEGNFFYFKFFGEYDVIDELKDYINNNFGDLSRYEYEYWNNTDHPKHLTRRQWETRRKKWNAVLHPGGDTFRHFLHIEVVPDFIAKKDLPFYLLWADTSKENFIEKLNEQIKEDKQRVMAKF